MKKIVTSVIICVGLIGLGVAKDFPKEVKKCSYGEIECIKSTITDILRKFSEADHPELGLVRLDPKDIPLLVIEQNKNSPVNIKFEFKDSKLIGLKDTEIKSVKGFGKDIKGIHEIQVLFPELQLVGTYTIDGRILILPITGHGKSNITFYDCITKFRMKGKPVEKKGKTYMEIASMTADIRPKRAYVHLENLFNGDKTLGETTNKFLNENFDDIYKEIKPNFEKSWEGVFYTVIKSVFEAFPYEDLYKKE